MAGFQDLDLPIALRRTPRHCVGAAAAASWSAPNSAPAPIIIKTPSKPRSKKRVRFSDQGPESYFSSYNDAANSTGLTPMVKRSWLGEPSPKRRRIPGRASSSDMIREEEEEGEDSIDEVFELPSSADAGKRYLTRRISLDGEAQTTEDGRKKTHRKREATVKELQRLRAELADRDAEIERMQNETVVQDTGRILELEKQIETLRAELAHAQQQQQQQLPPMALEDEDKSGDEDAVTESFYDWTLAARDPFSDTYLDEDTDITMMDDVACSTPSRRQSKSKVEMKTATAVTPRSASASFPTPPNTSPTLPATPFSARRALFNQNNNTIPPTPQSSHAGVQASLPSPTQKNLEAELSSLRLELDKLTATLESHTSVQERVSRKLLTASFLPPSKRQEACSLDLEARVDIVLQQLSDRTAALADLDTLSKALGFRGRDAREVIASIASAFRAARLELEYLTPGEITLPLTSRCGEVLDMVLDKLREMARKGREDDDAIDEYHALELGLRQQLAGSRKEREKEREETKGLISEKDVRISELDIGIERLKGAVEGYRRDIAQLEDIVRKVDEESKAKTLTLTSTLKSKESELQDKECELQAKESALQEKESELEQARAQVQDLERKIAETTAQLEEQLRDLQRKKDAETRVRNKSHGRALALRDARVAELRREIYSINDQVREAHETVLRLRVREAELRGKVERAEEGERNAREVAEGLRGELERAVASSSAFVSASVSASGDVGTNRRKTRSLTAAAAARRGSGTPEPGSFLSGEFARSGLGAAGKGKKRKYDPGLGLMKEDGDAEDTVELVS